MSYRISRENLSTRESRLYPDVLATLTDVEEFIDEILAEPGIEEGFTFSNMIGDEEMLFVKFTCQGDACVEEHILSVSAAGESEHWAEDWLSA